MPKLLQMGVARLDGRAVVTRLGSVVPVTVFGASRLQNRTKTSRFMGNEVRHARRPGDLRLWAALRPLEAATITRRRSGPQLRWR